MEYKINRTNRPLIDKDQSDSIYKDLNQFIESSAQLSGI